MIMPDRWRIGLFVVCTGLLICGWFVWTNVSNALASTTQFQISLAQADPLATCANLDRAATSWRRTSYISGPLAPVLRHLGWVPRVGAELRVSAELIALARDLSDAGAASCALVRPALEAPAGPERVRLLATTFSTEPAQRTRLRQDVERAARAWQRIEPLVDSTPRLAPYIAQLHQAGELLPSMIMATRILEQHGDQLPWILGLDAPRRLLVVLQNPFELRPTGGFIGLVCVLQIAQAVPNVESCRPSEAFDVPTSDPMPFPYKQYLRLGGYYLRDANWSPDFPTTAQTLKMFWELNQQAPVDGVIAADIYALLPLLDTTGALTLADGSILTADRLVEATLTRYYDRTVYRDKSSLADILPVLLNRILKSNLPTLVGTIKAVQTAAAERHFFVTLDQPDWASALSALDWDGALTPPTQHTLRIVDADVGYGAVNAFIERLTQYDIELDAQGVPLTATVTLTYTNQYSPWAESTTAFAVNGQCTDPQTLELQRRPGCYADYLRVFTPRGSTLIQISGVENSLGSDIQHEHMVFGGYFRILPGEQRSIQIQYRLPALTPGRFVIEKQAGLVDAPSVVIAHAPAGSMSRWVAGRTDEHLNLFVRDGRAQIEGAGSTLPDTPFERYASFMVGMRFWQAGMTPAARQAWQSGDVLERALDYGRSLVATDPEQAIGLFEAIATTSAAGRARFELASVLESRGEEERADQMYREAAGANPDHPLAQLMWLRRLAANGQELGDLSRLASNSAAVRRWRATVDGLEQDGNFEEAAFYLDVLRHVQPDDELSLRRADLLLRAGLSGEARTAYKAISQTEGIWSLLARAKVEELNGNPDAAIAAYSAALPVGATYAQVFRIGDGLRELGAVDQALLAYDRASALGKGSIWPLLAAGTMLQGTYPATAQVWYERAQKLAPMSGYPDWALGTLLLPSDSVTARKLLADAVAKQPEVALFREALADASRAGTTENKP